MRICFKEVGQGDSIILEWIVDEQRKIGIIDSNLKKDGSNPTLNYLKSNSITAIEFILLTHPHTDHFSGLADILEYCEKAGIKIFYFLHTSETLPENLVKSVFGDEALSELARLFHLVDKLEDRGIIGEAATVNSFTRLIPFNTSWHLKFIAPSNKAIGKFNKSKYKEITKVGEEPGILFGVNNYAANWLSTVVKIEHSSGKFALLTSDTNKRVFKWLERDGLQDFRSLILIGQIPHHGARSNHYEVFWRKLRFQPGTDSIVSVGDNSYGHPSPVVITSMEKVGYKVVYTNKKEFIVSSHISSLSLVLDMISEKEPAKKSKVVSEDVWFDLDKLVSEATANGHC